MSDASIPIADVTLLLREALRQYDDIQSAYRRVSECALFDRQTRSAALGEISEHLIARMLNGERRPNGNKGFDVTDQHDQKIEIKSRIAKSWGLSLQFNFSSHTKDAHSVYCIAWDDGGRDPVIQEAYFMPISSLPKYLKSDRYHARITLKWLRSLASGT